MFVIRIKGMRFQPSARIAPEEVRPMTGAVSRDVRYPVKSPSLMIGSLWAGTPSSSNPKLPRAPSIVAS